MLPICDTIPGRNPPIATQVLTVVDGVMFLCELTMPEHTLRHGGGVPQRAGWPPDALWVVPSVGGP